MQATREREREAPPRAAAARLLSAAALLAACGGGAEGGVTELDDHVLRAPSGWSVERVAEGPRRSVILRDPGRTVRCQVQLLRDGRAFRDDDARAFVGDALARFRIADRSESVIRSADGDLPGISAQTSHVPASWLPPGAGPALLEVHSAARGRHLLSVVAAVPAAAPGASEALARCREVAATMTPR